VKRLHNRVKRRWHRSHEESRMTSRILLTLITLMLLTLPAATQPETSKLRISAVPIAGFTPIYAADKLGYFKQEGLEISIDRAAGGAQTVPLLVQGTLQLAVTPVVSVALANQQGFNLRLIPPSLDDKRSVPGQTAQIVLADSSIKSPSDLKGKRVAVNTINSVNWLYDRAFVRARGKIDPAEVQYTEVPFPSMIDALLRGSVDAINIPQPFHYIAVATGKVRVLGYPFVETQPGLHIAPYAGSAAWLDANPKTVKAFVSAMRKAIEHMRTNPQDARRLIAEFTGAKPELIDLIPIDDWSTALAVEDVQKTLQVMKQEGVLKRDVIAKDMIQNVAQ
jgi:NitT/TauT family transport system substrate-binding protein